MVLLGVIRFCVGMLLVLSIATPTFARPRQEGPVDGDEPVEPGPVGSQARLTLEDALAATRERNPDLLVARRVSVLPTYRAAQDRALPPPMLEGQAWQWPINTANPANTSMYMLTATQDLPGRGKRALRVAIADKDVDIARNDVALLTRDAIADVKRAYAELVLAREAIDLQESTASVLRQFADLSTAKYEAGRASQQDVLKAIVEISRAREVQIQLTERAALAEGALNRLMGRPPGALIAPLDAPSQFVTPPSVAGLERLAREHQPALRAAALDRERAEAVRTLTLRESKPDLFVAAGYMLQPHGRDALTASFGVTWPTSPWSRRAVAARASQSTAEVEAARARADASESRVELELHSAYLRLQSAQRRAELLDRTIVPQSRQALEVSRLAYETDRADVLALLDGRRMLLDAQLAYYEAMRDAAVAAADLERAVGVEGIVARQSGTPMPVTAGRLP